MIESIILMFALFFSITILRSEVSRCFRKESGTATQVQLIVITCILWGAFYYYS